MTTYWIPEINLPALEARVARIERTCDRYGFDFSFEYGDSEFRTVRDVDGLAYTLRYVETKMSWSAKILGWEVVALIEAPACDGGQNVIFRISEVAEIPSEYYTTKLACDHCNSCRHRERTFLVVNNEGKYMQLGSACINAYTGGLDPERIGTIYSRIRNIENLEDVDVESLTDTDTVRFNTYIDRDRCLRFTLDVIAKYGYTPAHDDMSTGKRVRTHLTAMHEPTATPESAVSIVTWASNIPDTASEYMLNVRSALSSKYFKANLVNIVVSAVHVYLQEQDRQHKASMSQYVGSVGDKITVYFESAKIITSTYNFHAELVNLIQGVDHDSNVYIWWTSTFVDIDNLKGLTGKVKAHEEFRGVKQTVLTRCKQLY